MARPILLFLLFLLAGCLAWAQQVDYNEIIPPEKAENLSYVDRLVQVAWQNWPNNTVVREKLNVAKEEMVKAKFGWLNAVNVNVNYFGQPSADNPTETVFVPRTGFGVGLNLGTLLLVPAEVRIARANRKIAEEDIKTQMLFVRAEVSRRYEAYLAAKENINISLEAVEDARAGYIYAKKKFEGAELTLDEYTKAIGSYHQARERDQVLKGDFKAAKLTLEEMLGMRLEQVEF